jgi:Tfp pilus assembly protein PilN
MIQFNLLPDIKLEYIKARRTRRAISLISAFVVVGCLAIVIILFVAINVIQRKHLSDLSADIESGIGTIQAYDDIDRMLTVQNQLKVLPDLHNQKPVVSRLFTYIQNVVPSSVSVDKLDIDFDANTVSFTGEAPDLKTINMFVDTLKFTSYSAEGGDSQDNAAFSGVVLTSFGIEGGTASYVIDASFDPLIFDFANKVVLKVPETVTTRSVDGSRRPLFQGDVPNLEGGGDL